MSLEAVLGGRAADDMEASHGDAVAAGRGGRWRWIVGASHRVFR